MVTRMRGESGQIGLKQLLGVGLLVVLVYAGLEVVPKVFAVYNFEDQVQTQSLLAGGQYKNELEIRESIERAARENHIPLDPQSISIQRQGFELQISLSYAVPFELFGKTFVWQRSVTKGNFIGV
jgi:hypothetical protein